MEKIIYASSMLLHFSAVSNTISLSFCIMFYLFIISWLWSNLTWLITFFFPSGIFPDASSLFTNCLKVPQMFLQVLLLSLLMVFLFVCFLNLFLSCLPAPQMAPWLIFNLLPPLSHPFFQNFTLFHCFSHHRSGMFAFMKLPAKFLAKSPDSSSRFLHTFMVHQAFFKCVRLLTF